MGRLLNGISDHLAEVLIGLIEFCLKHMFEDINNGMKMVVALAGVGPGVLMPEAFKIIKSLSDNVMLPLSSIIISFILTYELISMVIDKNNMHEVDSATLAKYLFKACISVFLLTKSYEITMAIFDVGAYLVMEAGKVILDVTDISVSSAMIDTYVNSLSKMKLWELYATSTTLMLEMFTFKIFTVIIAVLSYGRIVEIFLMVSVSPVAFATLGNKEWGMIGTNYIKGLVALAFQGFFIMVLVAVYSALVKGLSTTTNLPAMIGNLLIISVLFGFGLFKTSTIAKQIFTVR
jgi:hypothetical protein